MGLGNDLCMRVPATEVTPRIAAVELTRESVDPLDRVLITGGSGWIGRTALALLWYTFGPDWVHGHVLATASVTRTIEVLGCGRMEVRQVDNEDVRLFSPSLIINCAFPTRNRVSELGLDNYLRLARDLMGQLLAWSELPSVQKVVTLSSGAAVPSEKFPSDVELNPYGVLKAQEEKDLLELAAQTQIHAQVCRVWAISGPHVQHPGNYAFSEFIGQARSTGRIVVSAERPVIRAYASADDVVALSLSEVLHGSGLFDSSGESIEVGALASEIAERMGTVTVLRERFDPRTPADDYRGSPLAWQRCCSARDYRPAGLVEQIHASMAGLLPHSR